MLKTRCSRCRKLFRLDPLQMVKEEGNVSLAFALVECPECKEKRKRTTALQVVAEPVLAYHR